MKAALTGTNLLAGGAAAGLLLVLVLVVGVPLWLAAGLAVIAYAGFVLLRPAGDPARAADRAARDAALRRAATVVAELRRQSRSIQDPAAKARVVAIGETADRIVAVLAEDGRDAESAQAFLERYLAPADRLVGRYARLADRGLAAAEPALAKIEEQDLPLLDRKLRELYEGLHRGDLIDLEVASEMLEFDLAGVDPTPPRRLPQ